MKLHRISILLFSFFLATAASAQLTNPGFETGDLTGWSTLTEGASNPIVVASGISTPVAGTINPSLTGDFYAFTSQTSPGRSFLFQSFVVQPGTNRIFFDIAINNAAAAFTTPSPISFAFIGPPNQQARFDILQPGASITTENPADIIVEGFQTQPGDPLTQDWTRFDVDVSAALAPFVGQSVTLRFVQVDNEGNFNLALDNVSVGAAPPPGVDPTAATPVPTLPVWAFGALILLVGFLGAGRVRKQ